MNRRLFFILLMLTALLGIYIGHITTDGVTRSAAPTDTLQFVSTNGAFHHFNNRWEALPMALADALAEGSSPNADSRVWENCAVRAPLTDKGWTRVICPDGYTMRFSSDWHML